MENQSINQEEVANPVIVPAPASAPPLSASPPPPVPPPAPSGDNPDVADIPREINEDEENIPMELTVASVASAALAVMPEAEAVAAPGKKRAASPAPRNPPRSKDIIARMKKDLEEGRKRLKPEEINNPFSKEFNRLLLKKELLEREMTIHDIGVLPDDDAAAAAEGLYPTLNDPNFNTKIALRKEFFDTKMDVDNTKNVEDEAEVLCNAQIELAPNQQFVRNFLSVETPYNSLLLYHGLGTGKTCSAISVAEEMRDYMKQMGINQQIIVIASPNVQENFDFNSLTNENSERLSRVFGIYGRVLEIILSRK